jgi:hypothetical protein
MKPLIVVMFFSIVACAALTFREPTAALKGFLMPMIPAKGGAYVLSLIGGIGGSLTLLSYNYLLRDESKVAPRTLRNVRLDLAIAYLFTAVFGLSVMLIANRVFHAAGVVITDREAVSRMADRSDDADGKPGRAACQSTTRTPLQVEERQLRDVHEVPSIQRPQRGTVGQSARGDRRSA